MRTRPFAGRPSLMIDAEIALGRLDDGAAVRIRHYGVVPGLIADLDHPPLLIVKNLDEAVTLAFQIATSQRLLA